MSRDMQEELDRLEAALLEQEDAPAAEESPEADYEEEYEEEFDEEYEEEYEEEDELDRPSEGPEGDFSAYSNARTDVDLEEFSDAVLGDQPPRSHKVLALILVLLTAIFCLLVWLFFKNGGYLQ